MHNFVVVASCLLAVCAISQAVPIVASKERDDKTDFRNRRSRSIGVPYPYGNHFNPIETLQYSYEPVADSQVDALPSAYWPFRMHALTDTYPVVPNTFPSRPRSPVYAPAFNAADLEHLTPEDILSRLAQPPPMDAYWPSAFPKRNIDIHISETIDVSPDHVHPIYRYLKVAERTMQNQQLSDGSQPPESGADDSAERRVGDETAAMTKNALEIAESIDALMKALLVQPTEGDAVPATEDSWPAVETTESPAEETDLRTLIEEYKRSYAREGLEITENGVGRQASEEEEAQTADSVAEPKAVDILTVLASTPETEEESSSEMVTEITETAAAKEDNGFYRFEVGNDGLKIINLTDNKVSGPTKSAENPETYVIVEDSETTVSEDPTEDELTTTPKLAEMADFETMESSEEIQTDNVLDETLSIAARLESPEDSNMTHNIDTNEIPNIR